MTAGADFLALLADARVPGDARWLAALIQQMGAGWHEIPHDVFRGILPGGASDDKVSRLLRALEGAKWIESKRGGKGHSPSYRFIPCDDPASGPAFRSALLESLPESVRTHAGLSDSSAPERTQGKDGPAPERTQALSVRTGADPSAPSTTTTSSTSSTSEARVREDVELSDLHPMAASVLEGEAGTLGQALAPLRDYLALRVKPGCQYGYVRSAVGSLTGMDETMWRDNVGSTLREGRDEILRTAINDLLACDETGEYFRHAPGEFGNLRGKVGYLVKRKLGAERQAEKRRTAPPSERPERSAVEEQADIEQKRERARIRSERASTAAGAAVWDQHRKDLAAAAEWINDQDEDTVERVNRTVKERCEAMYKPPREAPKPFVESTLVSVVREERGQSRSGPPQRRPARQVATA